MKPPNLAEFRLPQSDRLAGQLVRLTTSSGNLVLAFDRASGIEWHHSVFGSGIDIADVVELRPGTFFIDIAMESRPLEALTVVMSCETGHALIVRQMRGPGANPAVEHAFEIASVDGAEVASSQPKPTRELSGRWHLMRYAPENLYEHIYISSSFLCAHNLATVNTPGRADCHPASYWKFADDLFVVGWREHDSEAAMLLCEDLRTLKSTGKVLHPVSPDRSASARIGGDILPVSIGFPSKVEFSRP